MWSINVTLALFLLYHSVFVRSYDFKSDYKKLTKAVECDKKCWFTASEITSKTIDTWPSKCNTVCGILTFNGNLDVKIADLQKAFAKMDTLLGAIRIDNTTLKDLSFLKNLKTIECALLGISIAKNPNLTDVTVLYQASYPNECPFTIESNPKLDVSDLCESDNYGNFMDMYVFDNKKDCGCRAEYFGTRYFQNCTAVFGNLKISNVLENSTAVASLASIRNMTGTIEIHDTNLRDMTVFKNLEKFKFRCAGETILNLHDNPEMTRFSLDTLKYVVMVYGEDTYFEMVFDNLSPDFCLRTDEVGFWIDSWAWFPSLRGTYCPMDDNIDNSKTCVFDKMSILKDDCEIIRGRVLIGSGDEKFTSKLESVTNIFGSLTVKNTNLTNLSFFANLKQVIWIEDPTPVIQLLSNPNLENLSQDFPNLRYPFNPESSSVKIRGSPKAFADTEDCNALVNTIYTWIDYEGGDCDNVDNKSNWTEEEEEEEDVEEEEEESGGGSGKDKGTEELVFLISIVLSVVMHI